MVLNLFVDVYVVGLFGRGIDSPRGLYLHRTTHTCTGSDIEYLDAASVRQARDAIVLVTEDSTVRDCGVIVIYCYIELGQRVYLQLGQVKHF